MTVEDSIDLTHVASTGSSHDSLLIFFITGNPGLIEYYRTFLTLCFDSLRANYPAHHIKVAGTSLRGFGVQNNDHQHHANDKTEGPYDLEQQIEHIRQMLEREIQSYSRQGSFTKVILMGHSVGSYILLEVLRRRKQNPTTQQLSNDAKVIGGICLFPTVTHIAKSPSGKKFSVCHLWSYHTHPRDMVSYPHPPLDASIDKIHAVVICHSVLCCHRRRGCSSLVFLDAFQCAANNRRSCYWVPGSSRRAHSCFHQEPGRCQASIVSFGSSILHNVYL